MNIEHWLKDETVQRCFLLEIDAYDPALGLVTHYFSNLGYISKSTDNPPRKPYPELIKSIPSFSVAADVVSFGSISLRNTGGALNALLYQDIKGRPVRLYLGDASWAKADFIEFRLLSDGLNFQNETEFELAITDNLKVLDKAISMENTVVNERDVFLPLTFGTVFNVTPVFLGEDEHGAHYQVHQNAVDSIAVRSGGLPVDAERIALELANGKFSIDPPPAGKITTDVQINEGAIDVVRGLFDSIGIQYDPAHFDDFASYNLSIGIYADKQISYREVINRILSSVGLRVSYWYDGKAWLYEIKKPVVSEFIVSPIAYTLSLLESATAIASLQIQYKRNHTLQNAGDLYASVSIADALLYEQEYSAVLNQDLQTAQDYPAAATDVKFETALAQRADAEAQGQRLNAMYQVPYKDWEGEIYLDALNFQIGQTVKVVYTGLGFQAGRVAVVLGFDWFPETRKTSLKVRVWDV